MAHRQDGLRRRQSIHHSIPRLIRLPALASIKCQMWSLDQKSRRFMVIVAHRASVRRPAACRCTEATLPGKGHDLSIRAIARPLPSRNNHQRPHAWLCVQFRCKPLEAGMMNPRRLSTVPAPWLRSVILATGVVGLLGAFGPAAIQNIGAAPHKDISAPTLSSEQGLAGCTAAKLDAQWRSRSNRCGDGRAIACGSGRRRINTYAPQPSMTAAAD